MNDEDMDWLQEVKAFAIDGALVVTVFCMLVVLALLDALERKDRLLRGCIGIMNSGPYMDAVLVRGAIEAITKEQK